MAITQQEFLIIYFNRLKKYYLRLHHIFEVVALYCIIMADPILQEGCMAG